uniref:Uncharacterized protein n=1 Tax=Lotharella oceanica TaxID=641309 RepID=A0A7S2X6A5_9EUKA|eukprot:CAMPEP_0170190668 /NCGR_PEP_ID=MMETSP0040_2-20121228/49818_1 /TAXON_ID=641309 /ORGANISM="Lotharella oceanica, Strain CCMP622" /LENGTH=137 /DNA_ID=CAMNT_0010438585 /DNA_START=15 /DNA_END=428 /DNA_ORIENTATION=-
MAASGKPQGFGDLLGEPRPKDRSIKRPEAPSWLVKWNPDDDPSTISCVTAFDIVVYCHKPSVMLSTRYRKGVAIDCEQKWKDFRLCMWAKYKSLSHREEATKALKENSKLCAEKPHPLWKERSHPPGKWNRITESEP